MQINFVQRALFRRLGLFLGLLPLLLISIPSISAAEEQVPRFERANCLVPLPENRSITCGYLIAPVAYAQPQGPTVRLPVVIIHSQNPDPAPDPILFTEGGPGYSSLSAVGWLANSTYGQERDIIILEQRGNRYAEPNLVCDSSMWWKTEEGFTPCLDSLRARGIDPTHYTTASIAADIDALRQVLDYETWNLYGASFSTRLMQIVMQRHPEDIRSVILQSSGTLSDIRYEHDPEHTARAIQIMLADCAADAACVAAFPDLESQLYTLIEQLNKNPISFEIVLPEVGEPFVEQVDGTRLLEWMVSDAFYGPAWPPYETAYLPLLIDQVSQGRTKLLFPWLNEQMRGLFTESNFAFGLYFAVNCQDDAPGFTADIMSSQAAQYPELDGFVRHERELSICRAWNLPAAPPLALEPLTSDIPTLILAGRYDPITPPVWGQTVANYLSHAYYVEFPSTGHNLDTDNPCAQQIKEAFLEEPTVAPNTSCMANVPKATYVLPGDLAILPGIYNSLNEIDMGNPSRGQPLLEFLAGGSLIIFLLALAYMMVVGVLRLVRQQQHSVGWNWSLIAGQLLVAATAVLGWVLVLVISNINQDLSRSAYPTLYFGLPISYASVRYLAFLVPLFLLLTITLVILTFVAWRRLSSIRSNTMYTLVAMAALVFSWFLIHWDLHQLFLQL